MKLFKYIIYAFIAIIVVSLIVLIIQPEQSQALRPDSQPKVRTSNSNASIVAEPTEPNAIVLETIKPDEIKAALTSEQISILPPFIQALPKDPAEVDSNGNGIRDDLEVYIGYKFPYQPKKRAVYVQMVSIVDKMAKERGRGRISRQYSIFHEENHAIQCWYDSGFSEDELTQFKALVLNNSYRRESYQATIDVRQDLDQDIIESLDLSEKPCDQMMKEYQMALQEWKPE
ncbi:hypothetical protein [Vibrio sp. VB16]|uniref:hypothetical protein n=1 Tax=Vibrio sp. VB16 TaxID=2785746 RepID=UPI00189ECB84|nr:hypothetical protein [Vibrio sp. VB16]UGA56064.1 hypothetical protein IUZ65_006850 [Vibrio sp. VB16]